MKDSRIYRNMKIARADSWQRRKTRLQWPMWPSTQRIGKDIRASSKLFSQEAADVISEAYLTAMTGDRLDKLAAL